MRARIAVIARRRVWHTDAALDRIALVVGAWVVVVARSRLAVLTAKLRVAGVNSAGVLVVA